MTANCVTYRDNYIKKIRAFIIGRLISTSLRVKSNSSFVESAAELVGSPGLVKHESVLA